MIDSSAGPVTIVVKNLLCVVPVETPHLVGADLSALLHPPLLLIVARIINRPSRRRDCRAMFDLPVFARTFALAADPRVWFILLILGGAVLGRNGFFRSRWFNLVKPWRNQSTDPKRPPSPPLSPFRDRWFLFWLVIAATAVTAWIVMSMMVTSGTHR